MGWLLLLLLRVGWRSEATLADLPGEYRPNNTIISRVADLRRRLRRADMLGRVHGALRASAALQLAAQHGDLFLVPS